ncbi:MAG TPA: rhomboid family intramembrane serine protease [Phycisphaerales bacterium]|nr:rhomboid family intramembrane serine protease [Phycisphaerales bacterium]
MFIPLRTDRLPKRRPVVVESLIALNTIVYMIMVGGARAQWFDLQKFVNASQFDPEHIRIYQLFTYQFIHDPGSIWHLVFNMLGLWVFGCAVESRLGRAGFLCFYLLAGAFAALAHSLIESAPVIGASGAISGVIGAFLALFPRSNTVVFYLFTFSVMSIPSLWFIMFYIAIDAVRQVSSFLGPFTNHVAYAAHLAGYFYGFWFAFALLGLKIVKREEFDAFYLFKQMRRRAAHRAAMRSTPAGAWESASADAAKRLAKALPADAPLTAEQARREELRTSIHASIAQHQLSTAAAKYQTLLNEDPNATFTESYQLDLANQLSAEGAFTHAAAAYELLLEHYPNSARGPEVKLMLSVIYMRHLNRLQRARELLNNLPSRLMEPGHKALAEQLQGQFATQR